MDHTFGARMSNGSAEIVLNDRDPDTPVDTDGTAFITWTGYAAGNNFCPVVSQVI